MFIFFLIFFHISYGTGPLRRYVDILAQRQITAVLRGSGYLSKKYLLATVSKSFSIIFLISSPQLYMVMSGSVVAVVGF